MKNVEVNLNDFDFKFAFMLEVEETVEDVFNNPYLEMIGFRWNIATGFDGYIDLEMCSQEYYHALIKPQIRFLYGKPICFKD